MVEKSLTLKRLTSSNPPVPDLEDYDTIAASVHEKAELLARLFAVQCSGPNASSDSAPGAPYPLQSSDSQPNVELSPISEETVLKHLLNRSPAKSTGFSLLTNRVLREAAPCISCSLTYIYNLSLFDRLSFQKIGNLPLLFRSLSREAHPKIHQTTGLYPSCQQLARFG